MESSGNIKPELREIKMNLIYLRDENARLQGEIRILNSKVEAMKDAMDHAVGLFLPFCDTSIRSNEVSLRQEEISHQSNHSSALQSDEIDSRRTSGIFFILKQPKSIL